MAQDITEREELEHRLREAETMQAIGKLASGVAHDFNNMLLPILTSAKHIEKHSDLDSPFRELATTIVTAAERCTDLTRQLLAYGRRGSYQRTEELLDRLVADAAELLRHSVDKRIDIEASLDTSGLAVTGDRTQLAGMILNLALNGCEAMPEGGVLRLATRRVESAARGGLPKASDPPGTTVVLEVSDTGVGMDEPTRDRIFEPFFSTKRDTGGTGLGLASVLGTVQNHGGTIEVDSELGRGTIARVQLPAQPARAAEPASIPSRSTLATGARIMIVDDEGMVRASLVGYLTDQGHDVVSCEDGSRAVELLSSRTERVDLVLLDLVMPIMNGAETFDELRRIDPELAVVVMSGRSIEGQPQELLDRGALAFLEKPFEPSVLDDLIARALAPGLQRDRTPQASSEPDTPGRADDACAARSRTEAD
jgi:nitrogen-specific signal transduction histidine kinase/CheY-like chemotaxis protein